MVAYKRPESVLVVVHTRASEVLLLERRDPVGWWQSVTGSLEQDETTLRAALRELREETGLIGDADLEDAGIVGTFPIIEPWRARYAPGTLYNTEHVFRIVVPERFEPELSEHTAHQWLARDAAIATATSATDRAAITALVPA